MHLAPTVAVRLLVVVMLTVCVRGRVMRPTWNQIVLENSDFDLKLL